MGFRIMKILAIEKEIPGADWTGSEQILRNEALHVKKLMEQGIIKEIFFNEENCAVIILESKSIEDAKVVLSDLPLVKACLIDFELMELRRYTGFDRIK